MTQVVTISEQARQLAHQFKQRFGVMPTAGASAPGRVNLIGEHTDYNDGFVLPMAIQRQTVIVARPRADQRVTLASTNQPEPAEFLLDAGLQPGAPKWANYMKGVLAGCLARGLNPGGFDALVDSTVPLGGGLSSSASLEVATATLVEALTGQTIPGVDKALLCQQAEHRFAGVPCGIMDQFIAAMAQEGHAMLLDCRSHATRMVPLTDPQVAVLIANTNVKHELTGGEYAQRRAQCESAAAKLGVASLRDVSWSQLEAGRARLEPVEYRRARHVVSEIARTTAAAAALAQGDWRMVGDLMYASHDALRDDFEVSCTELDLMVDLARALGPGGGVIGSRMTGGGFGGCTVSLVHVNAAPDVMDHLQQRYQEQTGIAPALFVTTPAGGARVLSVS